MTEPRAGGHDPHSTAVAPGAGRARAHLITRAAALAAAGALVFVGLLHPSLRNAEGALDGRTALVLGVAAAALVWGLAAGTAWRRTASWLALLLAGQGAALQLVDAGNLVGYQHYASPRALLSWPQAPALALFAVQLAAVVIGIRGRARRWAMTIHRLTGWRWVAVAAAFVLTSAALSANPLAYGGELAFATFVQLLNVATLLLAVAAIPQGGVETLSQRFDRVLGRHSDRPEPGGVDVFAAAAALWVLTACGLLAWFSYEAHPHVPDEVVYLYHARYFAEGLLTLPAAPVPAAFDLDLMTYEATRWYSPVPPGWPAALAVGVRLGAAWLANPALNAINVLLTYLLLREAYDRRTARITLLLLCASPWFLFMGMNLMTHTFTLTCGLGAATSVARMRRGGSILWALPGGIGIGVMGVIRPLEGLTIAALLGLWGAGSWPWPVWRVARVAALAGAAMAAVAVIFPYNAHLSGDPLTFPLMAYTDSIYGPGVNALGFGADRGIAWPGLDPFPGHGPIDVIVNAALNLYSVNVELFGWATGSLLPILLLLALGRMSRADVWMITVIIAIIGVHSLYWFSGGPDFGARYWYLIIVPCIALSARAAIAIADRVADVRPDLSSAQARSAALAMLLALCAAALITFTSWRAADKYHNYRGMRPDVRQLAEDHEFGRSLVLVRGARHPDYASAAIYNPLDLHADAPVYVWDRDPAITAEVLRVYADRPVWILDGPTITGAGYRVSAGPMLPSAVTTSAETRP